MENERYEKFQFQFKVDGAPPLLPEASLEFDVFVDKTDGKRYWPLSNWRDMNLYIKASSILQSGGATILIGDRQHVSESDLVQWTRNNNRSADKKKKLREIIASFRDQFREELSQYLSLIDSPVYVVEYEGNAEAIPEAEAVYDLYYAGMGRTKGDTIAALSVLGYDMKVSRDIVENGTGKVLHSNMTIEGLKYIKKILANHSGKFRVVCRNPKPDQTTQEEFEAAFEQFSEDVKKLRRSLQYTTESLFDVVEIMMSKQNEVAMVKDRLTKLTKIVSHLSEEVKPAIQHAERFSNIKELPEDEEIARADTTVKIKSLIASYCSDVNAEYQEAYRRLYESFRESCGVDIYAHQRRLGGSFSKLQAARHIGVIEDLYEVAKDLFT